MEKRIEKSFNDEFLIVFRSETKSTEAYYWLNFTVYEIPSHEMPGNIPSYNKKGYTGAGEYVEKIEDAEVFIQGFLKWDGCTEWEFIDASHFCGWKSAHVLSRIIDALYSTAVTDFGFTPENLHMELIRKG